MQPTRIDTPQRAPDLNIPVPDAFALFPGDEMPSLPTIRVWAGRTTVLVEVLDYDHDDGRTPKARFLGLAEWSRGAWDVSYAEWASLTAAERRTYDSCVPSVCLHDEVEDAATDCRRHRA